MLDNGLVNLLLHPTHYFSQIKLVNMLMMGNSSLSSVPYKGVLFLLSVKLGSKLVYVNLFLLVHLKV